MQNLTISPLSSTLPQVRVLGRCAGTDPLTLFWTGSGIELLFTGSELWVELNADYDTMEPWVSVELDGAWISRFAVNPGTSRMCIFRGAAPGRAKHVRLLKDVQAMSEDPAHLLQVTAICHAGGEFLPLPMLPGWRRLCETFWRWYASTTPTLSSCGLTACWAAVCCRCCGTGWTNTAPSAVMSGCICWNCPRQGAIPSVPDSTPVPPPTALRPIVWRSFCAVCCNF